MYGFVDIPFDFGASGQVSWFYDGTNKQRQMNGNVEYIAMQFPITRRLAMSIGLLPYSYVGYDFGESRTEGGLSWGESFSGEGGLSDAYLGSPMIFGRSVFPLV